MRISLEERCAGHGCRKVISIEELEGYRARIGGRSVVDMNRMKELSVVNVQSFRRTWASRR